MKKILNSNELIQFILLIERHLLGKYKSVEDLLPTIRMFIYFSIALNRQVDGSGNLFKKAFNAAYWTIRSFGDFLHFLCFAKTKSIMVAPSTHRNIPGKPFYKSKHFDALIKAKASENFYVIESEAKNNQKSKYKDPFSFIHGLARLINAISPCPSELKLIAKDVCSYANELPGNVCLDEKRLLHLIREYETSSKLHSLIFRLKGIKKGYFIVYYLTPHLAMIKALNLRSGQSIEYQHGIQNDYQPLYTHWDHLVQPPLCLPKSIYVWDTVSKKRIDKWAGPLGIEVIKTGNYWIEQLDRTSINRDSFTILVALQKFPEHFNFGILDAVRKFPSLKWVFREHPLWPMPEDSKRELLSKFDSICFQTSKDRLLEEALSECAVCITAFSTVGIEALSLGVKTLFTHVNALNGLSSYIDNEHCFYADNAEAIQRVVQSLVTDP